MIPTKDSDMRDDDSTTDRKKPSRLVPFLVLLLLFVAMVAMIFKVSSIYHEQKAKQQEQLRLELMEKNQELEIIIDRQGRKLTQQDAIILESGSALAKATDSLRVLSKIKGQVITETRLEIIEKPVVVVVDSIRIDSMWLSRERFQYRDNWVNLALTQIGDSLTVMDSLIVTNQQTVQWGDDKRWFLAAKRPTVVIHNSCPYISTENQQSFVYHEKKSWYERNWIKFAIGAAGGYLIATRP